MHWFNRNTKGKLIFDERDYVYYDVIPNRRVEFQDYRGMACNGIRYKGILTIYLKAYCPFGKLINEPVGENIPYIGSAIVDVSILPGTTYLPNDETIILGTAQLGDDPYPLQGGSVYIYNPGTEPTPLRIRMAGSTTEPETKLNTTYGLIENKTNGTKCKIIGMTSERTDGINKDLVIDAETGRVTLVGNVDTQLAFQMHDFGYIWLAPSTPFLRDALIEYTSGSTMITSDDGVFFEDLVGQYVWLNNEWHKITNYIGSHAMEIDGAMDETGQERTQVVTRNEIVLTGFNLKRLSFEFVPRVR